MFTYTIRELKLLMLSLTLLILLIYNLVIFPTINSIFYLNTNKFYSNYIYSKTIPINSHEYINIKDDKENNLQVNNIKEKNNTQMSKSQRNTGNWKEVEKEGLMNFKRDTMWVAVTDTIYGAGFNADSMRYVPFGNGAQFEMAIRNDTTKSGAPLHLFQAQTPYETYLSGLNAQELANLKDLQSKLGKYCGLRVGDIEQPNNNAGNWE